MALTYEQIQAAAKKKGISQANVDKFAKAKGVVNPMKPADIAPQQAQPQFANPSSS